MSSNDTPPIEHVRPPKKNMKEMSKAERRAYQEAQRLAKEAARQDSASKNRPTMPAQAASAKISAGDKPHPRSSIAAPVALHNSVSLFSHLPQFEARAPPASFCRNGLPIHPAVLQLGLRMADFTLSGANARCVGMLEAFKELISEYTTPPDTVLSRHLTQYIGAQITYLSEIRPLAPSMGNAIRYLKHEISILDIDLPDKEAKHVLIERIDQYVQERITMAIEVIAEFGVSKIKDDDVILTFGHSSTVCHLLIKAHTRIMRQFRVIVIDSRPKLEGRKMAQNLIDAGIPTTYLLINALGYAMRSATKVILGAHGLLGNGALLARIGTAQIALVASQFNIPVIVACETYKFSLNIHLDSIVFNELANPDELIETYTCPNESRALPLSDWRNSRHLKLLNLLFDVTPPEFLTVVITELGLLPGTAVPAIIRERG